MVKAQDLIDKQKIKEDIKYKSYHKIYLNIEKKITLASSSDFYYIWYEVPKIILGKITYKLSECIEYLKEKLKNDGFNIDYYEPNILLIKWFPPS